MSIFESFNACKIFARGESESHRGDQGLALQVHHLLSQGLVEDDIDIGDVVGGDDDGGNDGGGQSDVSGFVGSHNWS